METSTYIRYTITGLLLILWIPISIDKFIHFELFHSAMVQQPFNDLLGHILAYALPITEVSIALLILYRRSRMLGFGLSAIMMFAFSVYVMLALLRVWEDIPCGCGLVFHQLGWYAHLWLNLAFLALSIIGYFLQRKLDLRKTALPTSRPSPFIYIDNTSTKQRQQT